MADQSRARELRERLRDELLARLQPHGWQLAVAESDSSLRLSAYVRPFDAEFGATAEIFRSARVPDDPPVRIAPPRVGVSYEPLRKLGPRLDGEDWLVTLYQHPDELRCMPATCTVEVYAYPDVAVAVDQLADVVLANAMTFARRYASVDAILAAYRSRQSASVNKVVPGLLAASGRFGAARSALAAFHPDDSNERQYLSDTRFAYQLARWLDGESVDVPPPTESESMPGSLPRPSLGDLWHRARVQRRAVDVVKRGSERRSRAEIRAMLEAELGNRGLRQEPRWLEHQTDLILAGRDGNATMRDHLEAIARLGYDLGRIGTTIVNAARGQQLPDLSVPPWLQPPPQATYMVSQAAKPGHRWTEVQIDPEKTWWLERAYAGAPRVFQHVDSVTLRAWMDEESDRNSARARVAVYIGSERVGALDDEGAAAYRPVLAAAADRQERPCAVARLTPVAGLPTDYLVELALPLTP